MHMGTGRPVGGISRLIPDGQVPEGGRDVRATANFRQDAKFTALSMLKIFNSAKRVSQTR